MPNRRQAQNLIVKRESTPMFTQREHKQTSHKPSKQEATKNSSQLFKVHKNCTVMYHTLQCNQSCFSWRIQTNKESAEPVLGQSWNLSLHGQLWNPFNVTSQCVVIMHICAVRAESVGLLNKSPRGCRLVWAGNFENHLLLLSAAHDSRTSKVWLPSISTASLQGDHGVRSASTTLHGIEVKIGKI